MHRFTGDGSTVAYNLDYTEAESSGDKCHVYVDGALQTYTTDYTVASSTLTFATGSIPFPRVTTSISNVEAMIQNEM